MRPLEQLAEFTRSENSESTLKKLRKLTTWYQEADYLRESVSHHLRIVAQRVNLLSDETMTDPQTGLYNRKGFSSQISHYDFTGKHSVIAIDIDHFKKTNDRYGHDDGDSVLVELSEKLRSICREQDVICRFGGEEFIIFLPDITPENAAAAAERIRYTIAEANFPHVDGITLSLGGRLYRAIMPVSPPLFGRLTRRFIRQKVRAGIPLLSVASVNFFTQANLYIKP